jgi:GTP-binding protein YchF
VGKSTLFNALTSTQAAQAANYPFCTIEPNVGRVEVPDSRLDKIAQVATSAKIIPTQLEFVDIAGLVRGASKGEGLGNQFLAHIREVHAILHVVRCFEGEVTHVEGSVDPIRDAETVETELMLADLDNIEKRLANAQKKAKGGDKEAVIQTKVMEAVYALLKEGKAARVFAKTMSAEDAPHFWQLQMITGKPVLYVCNVEEANASKGNAHTQKVFARAKEQGAEAVIISAAIEAELAVLTDAAERQEFLGSLGLQEPGLNRVIQAGYKLLGLSTYFTAGPKETRAWTITTGMKAPQAAGVIHTDFEKGFIRAEVVDWQSYVSLGGEAPAKEAGKLRVEGKDYVVADGDICHFRFNN